MARRARELHDVSEQRPLKRSRRILEASSTGSAAVGVESKGGSSIGRHNENLTDVENGIDLDDQCPVCQQLLYEPVVTSCLHYLCEACMTQWAEISTNSQMVIVDVDEEIAGDASNAAVDLEVNCPMCRTQTSGKMDRDRAKQLSRTYPGEYAQRKIEADEEIEAARLGEASSILTLTVYIGNRHKLAENRPEEAGERHICNFFVKASRTDPIEEVQIYLPSGFRPSRVIRTRSPYEIERTIPHPCTIYAHIILRAGYSWLSSDAEDSPDGAVKGTLPLEWHLDFTSHEGRGSMGRIRLKIKEEGGGLAIDEGDHEDRELRRDRDAWERMVREYQRDGLWNPDDSGDD